MSRELEQTCRMCLPETLLDFQPALQMTKANIPLWHNLYETAERFRDFAPWRWLYDSQLFGVQHPDTGEIGWCSIMGMAGEHFALAVYRGAQGLGSFFAMADAGDLGMSSPEMLNAFLSQNCLMVSFEDANMMSPEQKAHLKSLNKRYRGAGQWVAVQSYDPGFAPTLVDEHDLPYLIQCLEQAMEVAQRAQDDPDLIDREGRWLVRVPDQQSGKLSWSDTFLDDDAMPQPPSPQPVQPSKDFASKAKLLPTMEEGGIAISCFFAPMPIKEHKNKRAWHPVLLLGIAPGSRYIIGQQMANSYAEILPILEDFLLSLFKIAGARPKELIVHHAPMEHWLSELAQAAGCQVRLGSGTEPYFTEPFEALMEMLS